MKNISQHPKYKCPSLTSKNKNSFFWCWAQIRQGSNTYLTPRRVCVCERDREKGKVGSFTLVLDVVRITWIIILGAAIRAIKCETFLIQGGIALNSVIRGNGRWLMRSDTRAMGRNMQCGNLSNTKWNANTLRTRGCRGNAVFRPRIGIDSYLALQFFGLMRSDTRAMSQTTQCETYFIIGETILQGKGRGEGEESHPRIGCASYMARHFCWLMRSDTRAIIQWNEMLNRMVEGERGEGVYPQKQPNPY